MPELPTGTVTFLFTDIQGSTALLHELGDRYAAVLDEHAQIMRRAIAESGGVEVGTEGDSFFVAFRDPSEAVRAAVSAQRGLAGHDWPPGIVVQVRMGLHTGQGRLGRDGYVGMDVHRAARIAAAAHGGQVIVSGATRGLVEHDLPESATLRDLGQHRLKDIVHPESLYDLVVEGLPADFPAPRTLDAMPNNLPPQLTSFVGREEEMREAKELLSQLRLLTLTGAGGTGKTRLALRLAADMLGDFRDGAFFVDLSPLTDPALVPSAIAQALQVPPVVGRSVLDAVKDYLCDKELLLIVDNFEQVAEAAPVMEELLAAAPKTKVLITSRFVLSIRGEQEYAVPPLDPPDPNHLPDLPDLYRVEAVQLFAERARAVQPRFRVTEENAPAVAEITARLDGLPLAIELAATRTKVLTPEQMLPRLKERLSILSSAARSLPERQKTLRDTVSWSHDLLDPSEQRLLAHLSVFAGGWTLDAAEAVCGEDGQVLAVLEGLASLVDKSLVRRMEIADDEPRFSMLETIREFARERLAGGPDDHQIRRRHAEFFLDLALEAESHLTADDQGVWLIRCEVEHANIRAAIRWAIESGEAERAQSSAGALWRFWQQRGHLVEGRRTLENVLAMPSGQQRTPGRAKALIGQGGLAWWQKDREAAGISYREALVIERELGDAARIAEALYNLAFVVAGDDIDAAGRLLEESLDLFRKAGNEQGVAQVLSMLVIRSARAGEWETVIARLQETRAIWRRLGDRLHLAFDLVWLAFALGRVGRPRDAWSTATEALELFLAVDNPTGLGIVFIDLAFLANWEGRYEDAVRFAGVSESLRQSAGGPPGGFAGLLEGDPVADASEHLSQSTVRRAWEEGLATSVDEAVALARAGGQAQ
jgi:predicted ATPase/class 3 adenylate cyclase